LTSFDVYFMVSYVSSTRGNHIRGVLETKFVYLSSWDSNISSPRCGSLDPSARPNPCLYMKV